MCMTHMDLHIVYVLVQPLGRDLQVASLIHDDERYTFNPPVM